MSATNRGPHLLVRVVMQHLTVGLFGTKVPPSKL